MHEEASDNTFSITPDTTNSSLSDGKQKTKDVKKVKCIIGRKNMSKNCIKQNNTEIEPKSNLFDPNAIPEFLSFPNTNVSLLFKDKKFEEWNTAYTNWFMDKNRVASKTPNTRTIQGYVSELCRYREYVHESMKEKNFN